MGEDYRSRAAENYIRICEQKDKIDELNKEIEELKGANASKIEECLSIEQAGCRMAMDKEDMLVQAILMKEDKIVTEKNLEEAL